MNEEQKKTKKTPMMKNDDTTNKDPEGRL